MNLKKCLNLNVTSIFIFLVLLFLLADVRFFYLVPLPEKFTGPAANKVLAALIAVISFLLYSLFCRIKVGKFGLWIVSLYIIMFISAISSMHKFGFTVTNVLWEALTHLTLLMYFPLKDLLCNKKNLNNFIFTAEIISDITAVLFLIQYGIYTGKDSIFLQLNNVITEYYLSHPDIPLRVYSVFEGFIRVFVLIITYRCIKKKFKKCKFDILSVLLMLVAIIFIDQSRYYLTTLVVAMILMICMEFKPRLSLRQLIIYVFGEISAIGIIIIKLTSISNTIASNEGSSWARTEAIQFFSQKIKNHFLFGMGITIPAKTNVFYAYFKGNAGHYNYDDIGIFGIFFSLGIVGLIWYILFTIKLLLVLKNTSTNRPLSIAIIAVFILSYPVMSYLDKPRVMSLLMTMLVVEINSKLKQGELKQCIQ